MKDTIIHHRLMILVVLWGACWELTCADAVAARSYLRYVESHLQNLTTRGLDRYGPEKTGNWMAIIDTRTGCYPAFDHTPKRVYRKIGAPRGCSFYWDQPTIATAYQLSEITGEKNYSRAARKYIREFLRGGIDENGLFRWGNHRYYDAFKDDFVHFSGGYHEIRPYVPAWDLLWREDPQAVSRQIRVMASRHLHTPESGGFNRHDNGKREHAFLEAGAVLLESLAWLYRQTQDPELREKALQIARYSFKHRGEVTGLLINNPDSNRWDSRVCTTEVGLWANACLRAADYTGESEFIDMARSAVSAYLRYGYDADTGRYYGQLSVEDGEPVTPSKIGYWPRKYSSIWNPDQWPTHDYPVALAQAALALYQRKGEWIFIEAVHRWAKDICSTNTADRQAAYAGQYGKCIRFLLRAGRELKEDAYVRYAYTLADEAVDRLYENGWFQGYPDSHLYEAVDGVGFLLLALMDLEERALSSDSIPLETIDAPLKHITIDIPSAYLCDSGEYLFGGDIRMGDLAGDGKVDFLVYRALDDAHDGGGLKPCFLAAFTIEGDALWHVGEGGRQPSRPGPVALHDMDGDGKAEIICFFRDETIVCPPSSMENVVLQIREGNTGRILKEAAPVELRRCQGRGANWVHQRILIANLTGDKRPTDFIVKLGTQVLAFDMNLKCRWTYTSPWREYSHCPAYIPAVGDIDGDGRDEINGGYFLLDHDGTILWQKQLGRHMDSVAIAPWDQGHMRAFGSGYGHVLDAAGNVILSLGKEQVPHGQELRVAHFDAAEPGPQMMIRYNGHAPDVLLVGVTGKVLHRFKLNPSPNHTGMEAVYWNGLDRPALLYNGGLLWRGDGRQFVSLPNLPDPIGPARQGWYHCIPANICGDEREEVVVYNPWDRRVHIYTPSPYHPEKFSGYRPGPRQINVRLMD